MLARLDSCTLVGIEMQAVDVEVDIAMGLPGYHVVGLPAPAIKEGGVRIRSALAQVGYDLPLKKITVNLAPGDVRKVGTAFDLPIALGVMIAEEVCAPDALDGLLVLGELGLDGSLRPIRGALAAAMLARRRELRGIVLPAANAAEALVVDGIEVHAADHLGEVLQMMAGEVTLRRRRGQVRAATTRASVDMAEVRGQIVARAALEIAVAGGHNVLMSGPPGIGKTMLARRVPTILPPMSHDEALETTKIYSALGLADAGLVVERPFRAPHHTVSTAALLGGGTPVRPGEVSLAHNGVLFLDELPEFPRASLESLRQPLEDRTITIGRVHSTVKLPASLLLIASANPCPCGWLGSNVKACTCSSAAVERYRARLSGPLLDRIDLQVKVSGVSLSELRGGPPAEPSAAIRDRVVAARERQRERLAGFGVHCNAEMSPAVMRACCRVDGDGEAFLAELFARRRGMTARTIDRVIKVARTIADLDGADRITADHLRDASSYRSWDTEPTGDPRHSDSRPPRGVATSSTTIGTGPSPGATATHASGCADGSNVSG